MSGPTTLERCRMALAELGLPADLVGNMPGGSIGFSVELSDEQAWLLHCTANVDPGLHVCLPCYLGHRVAMRRVESYVERRRIAEASVVHACGADRPFQRVSCGAGGVA